MSGLTGIRPRTENLGGRPRLALTDLDHPITRGLPPGTLSGPREPIGPLCWCDDPKARTPEERCAMPALHRDGTCAQGMTVRPGLAAKQLSGWRPVWCGVPNLPACLLRGIARAPGMPIHSDQDDAVCANVALPAVHARHAGERTIGLLRPATVVDAFAGKAVARKASAFRAHLERG